MARQPNNNNVLDFVFRTPKKLKFSSLYRFYFDFILRLLYRVILFDNVPDTIEETFLKLVLYTQGKICFLKGDLIGEGQELLALNCSRADQPNVYYIPEKVLVVNPRLKKSYNLKWGEECEIVYLSEADKYNLSELNGGLYLLIERTATMLADNDISINIAQKNTRLVNLVSGDTQNTVDSIRAVIASMYEGDPTIVVKSSLIDKLQGVPIIQNQTNHNLIELIEVQQYIIAHFYEQIGICTHDQMKRERLVTAEINDNLDLAFLNIDDILVSVQEGLDRVNAMFGTNIQARLNPIIERQREEQDAALALEDQNGSSEAAPEEGQSEEAEAAPEEEQDDGSGEAAPEEDQSEEAEAAPEEEQDDGSSEAAPEEDQNEEAEAAPEEEQDDGSSEAAPEEDQGEEAEAAPEEEQETPEEQHVEINIEGDNNVIIIEGGDELGSTEKDELPNVGSDSSDGTGSDDE